MKRTLKTRTLNFFRLIFRFGIFEKGLQKIVEGHSTSYIFSKLVPNNYQYRHKSMRSFSRNGLRFEVDIHDYVGHYAYFGFKDLALECILDHVKEGDIVLDVGSNIGYYLINIAQKVGQSGRIYGFEAYDKNFDNCKKNLLLNDLPQANISNWAVSSKTGTIFLDISSSDNQGKVKVGLNKTENAVKCITLDQFYLENKLEKVDFIKIDVEGYEYEVLLGATSLLHNEKPKLLVELDDGLLKYHNSSPQQVIALLHDLKYTIFNNRNGETINAGDDFSNCHYDIYCETEKKDLQ